MKKVYLVYIKDNKNYYLDYYLYAEAFKDLLRGNDTLLFDVGIEKDAILYSYDKKVTFRIEEDSHLERSSEGKKTFVPGCVWKNSFEHKLNNVVVTGQPEFEISLSEDILDCDHKFKNLFLISSDKKELNRVARELKDKMTVGTKPTYYSINLSKAHIKNIKED